MRGSHRIIVESKKVKYDFIIKRNITILTGDSGSGKTVLIDFIREYRRYGADSGVFVSCDCECKTINNEDWERQIEETSNSIIFIDEGNRFLTSRRFAELVQQSDNYFVLATREKLPMLPYSVNEIYGFRQSGKFHGAKKKYNEIYHLYGEISERDKINPQFVITEDSNSRYDFFNELSNQKKIKCISSYGKSNIIKSLQDSESIDGTRLVIVDGAAFGSEMRDISEYLDTVRNVVLYAPESFEWILLSSNTIPNVNVAAILQQPEKYIDSKEYASWEKFFTTVLTSKTQNDPVWAYSKKKLPKAYLSSKVMSAVKKITKLIEWN
ncbi:ATP-binding protein [Frisingicoccus sp.]|uniref:ATP-binding protein n=1 Tax=Frisingicoccus sp. TaxID=1918627 RepID=UPI003AB7ECCB